ncbi:MAG: thiamine pyrophosphate-dependent enzyme, partial [Polyangiaceae bacterium]
GLINALNGLMAARCEGAKVVLISGSTAPSQRGRHAFQETSPEAMPAGTFGAGPLFHYAAEIRQASQLPTIANRLREGFARPQGFVAHLAVPASVQPRRWKTVAHPGLIGQTVPVTLSEAAAKRYANLFTSESLVIWIGFGARHHADAIRRLAERTGARVICSPRGKGIFPEKHPLFLGVTGFAGHTAVDDWLSKNPPSHTLVLGTRLSEFTSLWNAHLVPTESFIHVDIDAEAAGAAFPEVQTESVRMEAGEFLNAVIKHLPISMAEKPHSLRPTSPKPSMEPREGLVRPQYLMSAIQHVAVDGSNAPILVDVGNSFAWTTNLLRFSAPGRFRVSTGWASMGHATAGVVGAAIATGSKVLAIVGDGAMLMQHEISTAVRYRARATWIILNDSQYGMIEQGMSAHGLTPLETQFPKTDFVGMARSLGANGITVENEAELCDALQLGLDAHGPFVIDVQIDNREKAPIIGRVQKLMEHGEDEGDGES